MTAATARTPRGTNDTPVPNFTQYTSRRSKVCPKIRLLLVFVLCANLERRGLLRIVVNTDHEHAGTEHLTSRRGDLHELARLRAVGNEVCLRIPSPADVNRSIQSNIKVDVLIPFQIDGD